jgi:hypothetical protein
LILTSTPSLVHAPDWRSWVVLLLFPLLIRCGSGVSMHCGSGLSMHCGSGVSMHYGLGVSMHCGFGVTMNRGSGVSMHCGFGGLALGIQTSLQLLL